jgi:2-oxoglutarate dehydrogenase E1 component
VDDRDPGPGVSEPEAVSSAVGDDTRRGRDDPFRDLDAANRAFVEALYARWLEAPSAVPAHWSEIFEGLHEEAVSREEILGPEPVKRSIFGGRMAGDLAARIEHTHKNAAVLQLISAYRRNGHLIARLDPLGLRQRERPRELTLGYWGLSDADLETVFDTGRMAGPSHATLGEIVERLEAVYCGPLGIEFMYIRDEARRRWVEQRVEEAGGDVALDRETATRVLEKLTAADRFERFVHTKYLGAKRFSVEGGEALIPLLDTVINTVAALGVRETIIGMAHRGRLNVLANIVDKARRDIFEEFEDTFERPEYLGSGDVKYHLGYANDIETPAGHPIHVRLAFNPSHLEFVGPVVTGMVRGKQRHFGDHLRRRTMPLVIHGDAAFAGQGVVAETVNLARLPGYTVGGTIHVVLNNQIGFTTPAELARSSEHASDVVKAILPPVFHVNGDDLGAVVFVAKLAAEYRQKFKEDVVIDLCCYRQHGHNEGDEPAFTNPSMYRAVRDHPRVLETFVKRALDDGLLDPSEVEDVDVRTRAHLEDELEQARGKESDDGALGGLWKGLHVGDHPEARDGPTGLDKAILSEVAADLVRLPDGFALHPRLKRVFDRRAQMGRGDLPVDWAMGEALALGSLLFEGHGVRLTGQDSGRGTFSHRHAVLYDQVTGEPYVPLQHLRGTVEKLHVWDSPLSEIGCLAFEYGYSLSCPESLVIWEAQYGDFVNVAQVIIDQFICSSAAKWNRHTGLVLFLPHGYEGQGPEHSSARLERFLQLSGEDNWRVMNLTTPAQLFHALRSQLKRNYRKPLVLMTPKSLLRHPKAVSTLDELAGGAFAPIIDDARVDPQKVERLVLCSGKIYYELLERREELGAENLALVRIEQLYPMWERPVMKVLRRYPAAEIFWCQEEPENMGAWFHVQRELRAMTDRPVGYIGRPRAASPATGSKYIHDQEQDMILRTATEI